MSLVCFWNPQHKTFIFISVLLVTLMATCWQHFGWPSVCPRSSSIQTTLCRTCWGQDSPQPCAGNHSKCHNSDRSTASSCLVLKAWAPHLTACVRAAVLSCALGFKTSYYRLSFLLQEPVGSHFIVLEMIWLVSEVCFYQSNQESVYIWLS